MAAADEELRDALAAELLDRIEEGSWERFDQLVLDVLQKMGYGGVEGAVERIGGTAATAELTALFGKTNLGGQGRLYGDLALHPGGSAVRRHGSDPGRSHQRSETRRADDRVRRWRHPSSEVRDQSQVRTGYASSAW
jgi:hypothetical protein